ncbi:hypothetical protein IscW_ISCW018180 [Ixodes scapularis]|uniref:Uncharacterized protein n=1 Tax=Ixodes scapularis TaxID=6945 RepID=B7PG17_IXOSC|nr:hypothetical protein IscW_ISCW018180 [Ixodes scapularis]|eukprot:XP_002434139.1 hypothetical protein IscW_ISCW018180 [Ixodes scapularis]
MIFIQRAAPQHERTALLREQTCVQACAVIDSVKSSESKRIVHRVGLSSGIRVSEATTIKPLVPTQKQVAPEGSQDACHILAAASQLLVRVGHFKHEDTRQHI